MSRFASTVLAALLVASAVYADMYLHFPPGSNDRCRERNDNRNNAELLFDSQNNGKGGYPWRGDAKLQGDTVDSLTDELQVRGDPLEFYAGSELLIEWTLQHSCGPDTNADCNVVIEYTTEDDQYARYLRDALPVGGTQASDNDNGGYLKGKFLSPNQDTDCSNTIPIPQSIKNDRDNFNDNDLNTNPASYNLFYAGAKVGNYYGVEYTMHETFDFYNKFGVARARNKGVFAADQELENRHTALFTRQDDDGTRHGFEVPEERDYYPWWNPSPWHTIAVLVSRDVEQECDWFRATSQNKAPRFYCEGSTFTSTNPAPITEAGCTAAAGTWTKIEPYNEDFHCGWHPVCRDNHLGNCVHLEDDTAKNYKLKAETPREASYKWTIPNSLKGKHFVIRVRYNMTSTDYPQANTRDGTRGPLFYDIHNCSDNGPANQNDEVIREANRSGKNTTAKPNCEAIIIAPRDGFAGSQPTINRPYVALFADAEVPNGVTASSLPTLSIAMNTDQVGRTFQDRSYVLFVKSETMELKKGKIYNLNVRGKRGNIVQAYPATEYFFVPDDLKITKDDAVHIQWSGSDFNTNRNPNDGEGWRFSDRFNIVATRGRRFNHFSTYTEASKGLFSGVSFETVKMLAYGGITDFTICASGLIGDENNDNNNQNSINNCGKLNSAPNRFEIAPLQLQEGTYSYMSTRNNNFSNRGQKGIITVGQGKSGLGAGAIAGITIGTIAGVAIIGGVGFLFVKRGGIPSLRGGVARPTTSRV